jgi:hypothetical protein
LKQPEDKAGDEKSAELAAIAAGLFVVLGSTAQAVSRNSDGSSRGSADNAESNWKSASRQEALR